MTNITFKLDDGKAQKMLNKVLAGMKDWTEPLLETEKFQQESIQKQFDSEGDHITGKWKGLSSSTIAARLRLGFGRGPILQNTGRLKRSFRRKELTTNKLSITSEVPYYAYHQLGTKRMTQRQIAGHSKPMIMEVMDIFAKYIIKLVKSG